MNSYLMQSKEEIENLKSMNNTMKKELEKVKSEKEEYKKQMNILNNQLSSEKKKTLTLSANNKELSDKIEVNNKNESKYEKIEDTNNDLTQLKMI